MKEIIKTYLTCYAAGTDETLPVVNDSGKNYAVRLVPLQQVSGDGLLISELETEGTNFLGVLDQEPIDPEMGSFYYDRTEGKFYIVSKIDSDGVQYSDGISMPSTITTNIIASGTIGYRGAHAADSDVSSPQTNEWYFNTGDNTFRQYSGTWAEIANAYWDTPSNGEASLYESTSTFNDENALIDFIDTDGFVIGNLGQTNNSALFYDLGTSQLKQLTAYTGGAATTSIEIPGYRIAYENESLGDANWTNVSDILGALNNGGLDTDFIDGGGIYIYYYQADNKVYQMTAYNRSSGTTTINTQSDLETNNVHFSGVRNADPAVYPTNDWGYDTATDTFFIKTATDFATVDNTDNLIDTDTKVAVNADSEHDWANQDAILAAFDDGDLAIADLASDGRVVYYNTGESEAYALNDYTQTAASISPQDLDRGTTLVPSPFLGEFGSLANDAAPEGQWYFNTSDNTFYIRDDTEFVAITDTTVTLTYGASNTAVVLFQSGTDVVWTEAELIAAYADGTITTGTSYVYNDSADGQVKQISTYTAATTSIDTEEITTSSADENYIGEFSGPPSVPVNDDWYFNNTSGTYRALISGTWGDVGAAGSITSSEVTTNITYHGQHADNAAATTAAGGNLSNQNFYWNTTDSRFYVYISSSSSWSVRTNGQGVGGIYTVYGESSTDFVFANLDAIRDFILGSSNAQSAIDNSNSVIVYNGADNKVYGVSAYTAAQPGILSPNIVVAFEGADDAQWANDDAIIAAFDDESLDASILDNGMTYVYYTGASGEVTQIITYTPGSIDSITALLLEMSDLDEYMGVYDMAPQDVRNSDFYYHSGDANFRRFEGETSTAITSEAIATNTAFYLGSVATDALAQEEKGDAVAENNFYWNTTDDIFRYWDTSASAWTDVVPAHLTDNSQIASSGTQISFSSPSNDEHSWNNIDDFKSALDRDVADDEKAALGQGTDIIIYNEEDDMAYLISEYSFQSTGQFEDFAEGDEVDGYGIAYGYSREGIVGLPVGDLDSIFNYFTGSQIETIVIADGDIGYRGEHSIDRAVMDPMAEEWYFNIEDNRFRQYDGTDWGFIVSSFETPNSDADVLAQHAFIHEKYVPYFIDGQGAGFIGQSSHSGIFYDKSIGKTKKINSYTEGTNLQINTYGVHSAESDIASPMDGQWYYNNGESPAEPVGFRLYDGTSWATITESNLTTIGSGTTPAIFLGAGIFRNDDEVEKLFDNGTYDIADYPVDTMFVMYFNESTQRLVRLLGYENDQTSIYRNSEAAYEAFDNGDFVLSGPRLLYYDQSQQAVYIISGIGRGIPVNDANAAVTKTSRSSQSVFGKLMSVSPNGRTCRVAISGANMIFARASLGEQIVITPTLNQRQASVTSTISSQVIAAGDSGYLGEHATDAEANAAAAGSTGAENDFYWSTTDTRFRRWRRRFWAYYLPHTDLLEITIDGITYNISTVYPSSSVFEWGTVALSQDHIGDDSTSQNNITDNDASYVIYNGADDNVYLVYYEEEITYEDTYDGVLVTDEIVPVSTGTGFRGVLPSDAEVFNPGRYDWYYNITSGFREHNGSEFVRVVAGQTIGDNEALIFGHVTHGSNFTIDELISLFDSGGFSFPTANQMASTDLGVVFADTESAKVYSLISFSPEVFDTYADDIDNVIGKGIMPSSENGKIQSSDGSIETGVIVGGTSRVLRIDI